MGRVLGGCSMGDRLRGAVSLGGATLSADTSDDDQRHRGYRKRHTFDHAVR